MKSSDSALGYKARDLSCVTIPCVSWNISQSLPLVKMRQGD